MEPKKQHFNTIRTCLSMYIQNDLLRTKYLAFYDGHLDFEQVCAGAKHHHWWVGGLVEHCTEMLGVGLDIMGLYPEDFAGKFTQEDLTLAIYLHDFAKIWTYRTITDEERARPGAKFHEKQVFTYVEGVFDILDGESLTLLELGRYQIVPSDLVWSAVLFAEGGYSSANFDYGGRTSTSATVNSKNPLAPFLHMLDMYSSQLLGKSLM